MSRNKWPSREAIERLTKKVEENPELYVSHGLPSNAPEKDRIKYELCGEFIKYMNRHEITQRELAKRIGIDEALISKVVHYHIDEFSLDRLYDFLNTLDSGLTLKVTRKKEEAA
ncbi:XRE family transcriptional regulator [Bdellovibrionota bacterium FG-1]